MFNARFSATYPRRLARQILGFEFPGRKPAPPMPRTESVPTLYRVTRNGVVYKYAGAIVRKVEWLLGPGRFFPVLVPVPVKWHARQHNRTRRVPLFAGR